MNVSYLTYPRKQLKQKTKHTRAQFKQSPQELRNRIHRGIETTRSGALNDQVILEEPLSNQHRQLGTILTHLEDIDR